MSCVTPPALVCDPIHADGLELLRVSGFDVTYMPEITGEQLQALVARYAALIVRGRTRVTRQVIEAGTRLRVVGRAGVGLDNIDLDAARERHVTVLNTPEALTNAVAELVIGLMLAVVRHIARADAAIKRGSWPKQELHGMELRGKMLGVVGMGHIGIAVARLARAFGMSIIGYDVVSINPIVLAELQARMLTLEQLLQTADVVTLHVPLTPETRHLLNRERLGWMKPGAILVNASRGGVVDEAALYDALVKGRLTGAGLDVFEREPPGATALTQLPNVVCTPHIGGETLEGQREASIAIAQKLSSFFAERR